MKTKTRSVPLGDLIAAAFEQAERYSNNPEDISRLAQRALRRLLRHTRWGSTKKTKAKHPESELLILPLSQNRAPQQQRSLV